MKNKFKLLSICLLAVCLVGSATACFGGSGASESSTSSESLEETPGSSDNESSSDSESSEVAEKYTVAFVDYDDSVISTAEYEVGAAVVVPETPVRAADETYTYEFAGWDSEVVAVEGEKTYKATYTATYIDYTVIFVDENGEELSNQKYHYGDEVTVPELPTKEADETYTYTYAWDKEIASVGGDVTYTAVCTPTYIDYIVKFLNADDSEISTATYHYGDAVTIPEAPTKAADETYTYEFAGWDSEVVAVAGNVTYKATFREIYIDYIVKFLNADGSEISTETYHYGDEVAEPEAPAQTATKVYSFVFDGWDKEIVNVVGDAIYTAKYVATVNAGYKVNEGSAGENGSIVLNQSSIGEGASIETGTINGGSIDQSYLALDGNYALNDYVAFDFTGKNMPEVAFFAKNYNNSMYAEGTSKQGIVVVTGITQWDGSTSWVNGNNTQINYGFPYMIQDTNDGGFVDGAFANSALGRANLVDGTHYRVIMGFTGSGNTITLNWCLYNLDTKEVVEQSSMTTWGFFDGGNAKVGNMTINDLSGSIVLYGKFGTTCTIDKLHGVYENTDINTLVEGLNSEKTYTVTFNDANGNELKKVENLSFGSTVSYDETLPTPDKAEDALFTYSYVWDKEIGPVYGDTIYTLKLVSTVKSGYSAYNVTAQGDGVVLGAGGIGGDGASIETGAGNGYVDQAYLALDGNYALNNYVALDFTGKNMPEVAFFAKNYNKSMYAEGTSKQGIVVVTGITQWNGATSWVNGNSTQINYGFPYMIQNTGDGGFVSGAFANSALGRANLVDGTHYRVIMGFTGSDNTITLNWCLYNLDTKEVVEQSSMTTWGFFSGNNAQVGNMTINDLSGSIVLYGKFGTTTTIDTLHGVKSGTFSDIVAEYTA